MLDCFDNSDESWLNLYSPIDLIEVFENVNSRNKLDDYVIFYMKKYGIDNIRGGSLSNPDLTDEQLSYIVNQFDLRNKTRDISVFPKVIDDITEGISSVFTKMTRNN
jgi:hypothetical protein